MRTITRLDASEILDSRGRPTLKVMCELDDRHRATASVPSGASTGRAEARELRDRDDGRYDGLGCRLAVAAVRGELAEALRGRSPTDQAALDAALVELDGTSDKARLGANTLLATSLAFARATARSRGEPLHRTFGDLVGKHPRTLPRPTINLFSGGKHAGGQVSIQDVLVVPLAASIDDCLAQTYAVYQAAVAWLARTYGARALRADEGGLAPPCSSSEEMIAGAVTAVEQAGLRPGVDMTLALDVAASHFYDEDAYLLDGETLGPDAMIARLAQWVDRYPIVSIEDGLAEDDWGSWVSLRRALPERVRVLGDDLLCTHPERIVRAVAMKAADALLLKVNQVGTLTEAGRALRLADQANWHVTVSARSGETEDDWLADLAIGWGAHHVKIGSITQSERLAKYNRLLDIERESDLKLAPVT